MIDYEQYLHSVIRTGDYILSDLENRIDALWIEGRITDEARIELKVLAAENARDNYADLMAAIHSLETRVLKLEDDQYAIWTQGYQTKQHEIVRYDVTGDGEYDLCRYDGGRSYTALSIGKIEGWHLLDRELNATHDITRDAEGGYVLTPIEQPTEEAGE